MVVQEPLLAVERGHLRSQLMGEKGGLASVELASPREHPCLEWLHAVQGCAKLIVVSFFAELTAEQFSYVSLSAAV
jgi:hypothetical protein